MKNVIEEIADERARQVTLGFDAAHDGALEENSLLAGAIAKAMWPIDTGLAAEFWWRDINPDTWFNGSRRQLLIESAAMIVAEIERMDRSPETKNERT